jgi:hypothetical protein
VTVQILIWLPELMQIALAICIPLLKPEILYFVVESTPCNGVPFYRECSLKIAHEYYLLFGQALDLLVLVS